MVTSYGVVGSAYLSKNFDSEPVNATKLLIGVSYKFFGLLVTSEFWQLLFHSVRSFVNLGKVSVDAAR
jgi:hypothetical protein